jgi:hypothetical protein
MKAVRFLLWFWTFGMVAFGGWLGWMMLDRELPYAYFADESFVTPDPAPDGGRVTVDWRLRVNRLCPGSSLRTLTDVDTGRTVVTYDATPIIQSVRIADDHLTRTFMLPRGLPPRVGYRSLICFRCNVLQALFPLCQSTPTLTFNVKP